MLKYITFLWNLGTIWNYHDKTPIWFLFSFWKYLVWWFKTFSFCPANFCSFIHSINLLLVPYFLFRYLSSIILKYHLILLFVRRIFWIFVEFLMEKTWYSWYHHTDLRKKYYLWICHEIMKIIPEDKLSMIPWKQQVQLATSHIMKQQRIMKKAKLYVVGTLV